MTTYVWVVFENMPYDSNQILGIFTDEAIAKEYCKEEDKKWASKDKSKKRHSLGMYNSVQRWELNIKRENQEVQEFEAFKGF